MARRRKRRRRRDRSVASRITAGFVRVLLVILVSVAVAYAFYYALRWVAAEADRRGSASASRTSPAALAREG